MESARGGGSESAEKAGPSSQRGDEASSLDDAVGKLLQGVCALNYQYLYLEISFQRQKKVRERKEVAAATRERVNKKRQKRRNSRVFIFFL